MLSEDPTVRLWKPIPIKISSKPLLQILAWPDVTFEACTAHSEQSFADTYASFCAEILQFLNFKLYCQDKSG